MPRAAARFTQADADALGLTLSAWVRMTLLKAAKEKK